ncbi:sodium/potassium-transporting ATPase subunit beta-1-interacting protein isoform X2 [Chrysoperla carnea]|uniref:sodium/potassium-transporting ATPase subunit beta-1-interacting protein isoform X2 n=1 Tax=Chrysoperla carnea TaxID=189513 RepID=UPI001D09029F|nr:sodium/potassium-transporting ATPase subunit beta-1-interacting protein isoform X2 [Chrysoperla carnea]
MGICARHTLIATCILQLITTFERQIFDFLGFMWAPILINFFHIIFIIFGLFGAFQHQFKYVISNSDTLNLGTGSVSWWEANGYGCKPYYLPNITNEDIYRPVRPDYVTGCLFDYTTVEIIHAAIQVSLGVIGIIAGICCGRVILRNRQEGQAGSSISSRKSPKKTSLYSIEFSTQRDDSRACGNDSDTLDSDMNMPMAYLQNTKPMTPRRVKRRSVMTRGHPHHGNSLRKHSHGGSTRSHNSSTSVRSSQRRQNPVTQILDQQLRSNTLTSTWQRNGGHTNPTYQQSSIQSLNEQTEYELYNNRPPSARSSYSNYHGSRYISSGHTYQNNQATPQAPIKRDRQRQSLRSMAFLNSGPPAYTLQGSNQLDSETTI